MGKKSFTRKSFYYGIMIFLSILIVSCGTVKEVSYQKETYFDLGDKTQSKQSKGGISIILKPVGTNLYKKSYYKQQVPVIYKPFLQDEGQYNVEVVFDYFRGLTPFEVTIINNTEHILRMGDSRIAFIDPSSDEPLMALDKSTIIDDLEGTLPAYNYHIKLIKEKYPRTPITLIETGVAKALYKITKRLKLVNAFNREVLPHMKYTGLVVFPVDPETAEDGKVSFIDLVSKVNEAGVPVEKVRFDYRVKTQNRFYKYDPETDVDWVEIDEEEYNMGKMGKKKQ